MSIPKPCALVALSLLFLGMPAAAAAAPAPETPDTTVAASANAAGELADGLGVAEFTPVQISEDGRYVAFQSAARNLGETGTPGGSRSASSRPSGRPDAAASARCRQSSPSPI